MNKQEKKDKAAADRTKAFLAEKRNALCAIGTQNILPEQDLSTEPAKEPPRDS